MIDAEATRTVHEAIQGLLDENEIAIAWTITIDVVGSGGTRYLAHRAGGGPDGSEPPMIWQAFGMLRASAQVAEDQLRDCTTDQDGDDGDAAD